MRSLTGTFAFLCFVGSVYYLPLSIFFIIFNAAPFSTALLGWCWNREKITCLEIIAMICAFAGVIMIGVAKREQESEGQNASASDEKPEVPYGYQIGVGISIVTMIG